MFFDVYEVVAGGRGGGVMLVYLSRIKSKYLQQSSWENSVMAIIKATTACTSCTLETRYLFLSVYQDSSWQDLLNIIAWENPEGSCT